MKRSVGPMLALLLLVCTITGCASTPREQYAQVQDAYISTVTVLLEARSTGEIDEDTWQQDVVPLINLGDQALDQYGAATQSGNDPTPALITVRDVLAKLRPFVMEYMRSRE
jgi:hypothetical protein